MRCLVPLGPNSLSAEARKCDSCGVGSGDDMAQRNNARGDHDPPRSLAGDSRRARLVSTLFIAAAVAMVPWIVFLGWTLPPKYSADHWNLLWIGFDVALVGVLAYAAWAAWSRRQILASTAIVTGTLLICDAWFDIVTSLGHRDQWLTLLTGLGAELPLAVFFFWLYRRIVMRTLASVYQIRNRPGPRRLREAKLLYLPDNANRRDDAVGQSPRPAQGGQNGPTK